LYNTLHREIYNNNNNNNNPNESFVIEFLFVVTEKHSKKSYFEIAVTRSLNVLHDHREKLEGYNTDCVA
jgi:hypothetical protein